MTRRGLAAYGLTLLLSSPLGAQTSQPIVHEPVCPSVTFPLRHGYTRLHPDRVAVLEPRFNGSPAEALKVLVVFSGGEVMLFDPVKNTPLWPAPLRCAYEPTLLTLNDRSLVFATSTQVICVDRSSGVVSWRFGEKTSTNPEDDPEWQATFVDFATAPDRLVVANDRRELTCVNMNHGAIAWRVPDGPQNPGVLVADAQYVVTYDENAVTGWLTCRYIETGNKFHSAPFDRDTTLHSIVDIPGAALLAVTANELVSFDSGTLAVNWRVTGRPVVFSSTLLVHDDSIVVSDDGGSVTRYDARTGEKKWRSGRLAGRNDNVLWTLSTGSRIVAATPRAIAAYDAATGRRIWRRTGSLSMNEQAPVLINGAVLSFERPAPASRPTSRSVLSQPAAYPLIVRRLGLADGAGGEPPESALITEPLQSFSGIHVRNHAVIVLDGNRLIGYVDASTEARP